MIAYTFLKLNKRSGIGLTKNEICTGFTNLIEVHILVFEITFSKSLCKLQSYQQRQFKGHFQQKFSALIQKTNISQKKPL